MSLQNTIRVPVYDFRYQTLSNAEVVLTSRQQTVKARFDKYEGAYTAGKLKPGIYTLTVSATGLVTQNRDIVVGTGKTSETFILGKKGMSFYYRGRVMVPIDLNHKQFGVALHEPTNSSASKIMEAFEKQYKISRVKTHQNYLKNGLYVFNYPSGISESEQEKLRQDIQQHKDIHLAGPVLKLEEKNASILTDEMVARFKGGIEKSKVTAIAKEYGLTILRTIPYAGNAYHFRVNKGNGYYVLGICHELVKMGIVEYAEPSVFTTFELDAIVPNNFLFPEQWDHRLINTPDAWQVVNDQLGAPQRFGSPDVVVAVVDPDGINTAHPHFNGNVSNGQPKLLTAFNFVNMQANNNALGGEHGTNCASSAVGFTNVSSAGGAPDGTVGIAGNCRLIAIRLGGAGNNDINHSDMYIWLAGFNPNSVRVNFPAQLARGADVISNSFGGGAGAPITGIMADTFDYLTTYGRNGKGVVVACSVGNVTGQINYALRRPWAAYEKTFGCGASTLANNGATEIIADYSCFDVSIDFCAPSHDTYVNGSPLHNPPVNYGAFAATPLNNLVQGDGNAPRNREVATTMTAAAAANANSIRVASTAGMVNGQAIFIGVPSLNISPSETKTITNINAGTNTITFDPPLFNAKANGTVVLFGNRDYKNNFGGTSHATPVIAGVAALMLSVNNRLTWTEVRGILRDTAVKIDPNNNSPVGRWTDSAGRISTAAGYTGPFFSQFFGFGRINAALAVQTAHDYTNDRDIYIRDNMADNGASTSVPPFWTGVDIWVNNAGAVPANYNTDANTVHHDPIAGVDNQLHVRFKNRGTRDSYPFFIRAYIAHFPGMEFTYPANFTPSVRPDGVIPNPITPGTYLIGEQQVSSLAAGADSFVTFPWTADLIPPRTIVVDGINVTWHPCILVEVSPHDGFVPTGNHVWNNNNLAQKNISVNYDQEDSDAAMVIIGHRFKGKLKNLRFEIFPTPVIKQPYFVYFPDKVLNDAFGSYALKNIKGAVAGKFKNRKVIWLSAETKVHFELPDTGLTPMMVGIDRTKGIVKDFVLNLQQYKDDKPSGSYGMSFRKGKPKLK